MHRDIKPDNILVIKGKYKLTDFGYACKMHYYSKNNVAGSHCYASPKLRSKFNNPEKYIQGNNTKDDVFSLGMTMLDMMSLKSLIQSKDLPNIMEKLKTFYNSELLGLVSLMLTN